MEGLIKRAWIIAAVVAVGGWVTLKVPPKRAEPIREDWMASHVPSAIGPYQFIAEHAEFDAPAGQSYRMSKSTYDTLKPSGILSRYYEDPTSDKKYDVVVIASDNSVSFHDPRVCFTASGWAISEEKRVEVPTKTRGTVPMTLVVMKNGTQTSSALYFYRSPRGYQSVARKMRLDMLIGQLLDGKNDQGVFYRFIPARGDISDKELQEFAASYLDEANNVSGGFF